MCISLTFVVVSYAQGEIKPDLMGSSTDPLYTLRFACGYLALLIVVLASLAIWFHGLARKVRVLLDRAQFEEIERKYHKYRPKR